MNKKKQEIDSSKNSFLKKLEKLVSATNAKGINKKLNIKELAHGQVE